MGFPTDAEVDGEPLVDAPIILEVTVVFDQPTVVIRSVAILAKVRRGAEEEIGVREASVGSRVEVRAGGGVIDGSGLVTVGDRIGRTVRHIAKLLVADATAEGELMLAKDFVEVLIDRADSLAHAIIPLRTAVGHEQVCADRREADLAEVIGQAELLGIVLGRSFIALHVHPLPLHAEDRFGEQGRRIGAGPTERAADSLHRDALVTGSALRQIRGGNVSR